MPIVLNGTTGITAAAIDVTTPIPPAELGTGTATNETFLRGDGTWANFKGQINASGAAPVYACRAWVNFDGTRDTTGAVSTANTNRLIRASGNVTSVLRNAAGDYTITFTTQMPDALYSPSISGGAGSVTAFTYAAEASGTSFLKTVTQYRVFTYLYNTGTPQDREHVNVQIFR